MEKFIPTYNLDEFKLSSSARKFNFGYKIYAKFNLRVRVIVIQRKMR